MRTLTTWACGPTTEGGGHLAARVRPPVLFVDDEPDILNTLRFNFDGPFNVLVAASGTQALAVMQAAPVAVLVVDQRMPGLSGLELVVEARRIRPAVVPIVLSGYVDADTLLAAINLRGIYRYVTKPWDAEELERTIRGALELAADPVLSGPALQAPKESLFAQRAHAERLIIQGALDRTKGNKSAAARELEITYRALVKIMRRLGMPVGGK